MSFNACNDIIIAARAAVLEPDALLRRAIEFALQRFQSTVHTLFDIIEIHGFTFLIRHYRVKALAHHHIGEGAVVMGGAHVMPNTRIPAGETWRGNPARKWQ